MGFKSFCGGKRRLLVSPKGLEAFLWLEVPALDPRGLPVEILPLRDYPRLGQLDAQSAIAEAYGARVEPDRVLLYTGGPRAVRHFLMDCSEREVPVEFCGQPSFGVRGLIEGFYGTPWTDGERRSAIVRMARNRLNAFLYGPKDDPMIRERWREPYDGPALERVMDIKRLCDEVMLDFFYLLAPGFTIEYCSEEEFEKLIARYRQMIGAGVRKFGLLLDDIPEQFQYERDKKAYPSLVDAHIDLCNRVFKALQGIDPAVTLAICPTEYWGDGGFGYLGRLGEGVPAQCSLFYTGPNICSHDLSAENARQFFDLTGHRPLYWDNYPVNDAAMTAELHIGPLTGRSADLYRYCEGLVINPMDRMEASMIPCMTIADYLYDSPGYEPDASYRRAVRAVAGEGMEEPMEALRQMCYKSCLTYHYEQFPADHPLAGGHDLFRALVQKGDWAGLSAFARRMSELMSRFERCGNQLLLRDCRPWLDTAQAFAGAVERAVALRKEHPEAARSALQAYLQLPEDVMKKEAALLLERISA
jgi:hyaluronoglucosaminidase